MAPPPRKPSARRRGRRIAQIVYWSLVVVVSVIAGINVTLGVMFVPTGPPFASCHDGLGALDAALERARAAAATAPDEGVDAALARFRTALDPEWRSRDAIAAQCKGAAADEGALDAIERLRYAEEHAVRREAGELSPLRRRVQAIVDRELSPGSNPDSQPNPRR